MPDRYRDRVQLPNQPRPMAAEAADEADEVAHAFNHHTHRPGYGGLAPRGSSLSWGFLTVASNTTPITGRGEGRKLPVSMGF